VFSVGSYGDDCLFPKGLPSLPASRKISNEETELTSFSKARKWQGNVRGSCSPLAAALKGSAMECQQTAYFTAASPLPFNDSGAEPSLTALGMLSG